MLKNIYPPEILIDPRSGREEIATFIKTKAGRHSVEYFPASQ
jgi:hypothetical protein